MQEFIDSKDWKIPKLDPLPDTIFEMLQAEFGWESKCGMVYTNSSHAKMEIKNNLVFVMVRAAKPDEWRKLQLGAVDDAKTIKLSYEFLKRHFTPKKPKVFIPKAKQRNRGKTKRPYHPQAKQF